MKIISSKQPDFERQLRELERGSLFDSKIEADARAIIEAVRCGGDAAVCRFCAKFDRVQLRPSQLRVTPSEMRAAMKSVSSETKRATELAHANIRQFALRSLRRDWSMKNKQGGRVGEQFVPLRRIGIHIPGASKPLVSTVLHTVTLAKAAGVSEIAVCNPCGRDGKLNPAVLYACQLAGATEIYRIGGAQAIAAMTFGTKTIRPVDKIFGPGNAWTVAAKRLVYGYVGIDLLPGPSELLVIADNSANPEFIAADLLAQAEHGSGHERVFLISFDSPIAERVASILNLHISSYICNEKYGNWETPSVARVLESNCAIVLVRSAAQAAEVANRLAPEHVELMVRNPQALLKQLRTAGAVFIGPYSPTVLGDYVAGPSHTLPTGGSGRAFSGLTADQFQRRMSVIEYDRAALRRALPAIEQFGVMEGLPEHARSARLRPERSRRD